MLIDRRRMFSFAHLAKVYGPQTNTVAATTNTRPAHAQTLIRFARKLRDSRTSDARVDFTELARLKIIITRVL